MATSGYYQQSRSISAWYGSVMKWILKRKMWLAVAVVVLGLIAFFGMGAIRKPKPIPAEKLIAVTRGDIARSVVARGKIEPLTKVEIKSKANGIIQKLMVDVGDRVVEGQVLAELDKENLKAQVREAAATLEGEEANLKAAMAAESKAHIEAASPELDFARREKERVQGLFEQKIASAQQLDDAQRNYEVAKNRREFLEAVVESSVAQVAQAKARVAGARAALDRANENLSYSTIRSPLSGIVLTRDREVGDAVSSILNLGSAATLIMTLGDVSSVYIKGEVDEADIGKAATGLMARTRVESFPAETFDGEVKRIAPMGKELNNVTTFEVRVTTSNPEGKLRVNMTANAEIVLEEHKNALLIPESALVYGTDKSAFVQRHDPSARDGWRKVAVKTGISNGQKTEVLSGLAETDKVVLP